MTDKKIKRQDFSVQRIDNTYLAYAHFAPFYFGDVQKGKHKVYQAKGSTEEEALSILIKVLISDLEEIT